MQPLIVQCIKELSSRGAAVIIGCSLIISICAIVGASYVMGNGYAYFNALEAVLLIVAFTVIVAVILLIANHGFVQLSTTRKRAPKLIARLTPRTTFRSILLFSAIMAAFWLPWLIANYPGGTYWDTYYQIFQTYDENHPIAIIPWAEIYQQTLTDAWLVDHHPVFTTLVYGAFGQASDALTGNWMAGVFAFCCLQGAAHIVLFTWAVAHLRRTGANTWLCFGAYVFFCIMPFISTWAMCMVKDSFFGLFCIPYFVMLYDFVRTRGKNCRRPRTFILFCICALGLCLTKKTGLFIVVPTSVIAILWVHRNKGARVAAWQFVTQSAVCVALLCAVFPLALFPALNIASGGTQEILGPLFQQTARVVNDFPDDVTPEEKEAIAAVLDYDKLADQYVFNFEDSVKYRYNLESTPQQLMDYLGAWAAMGARHPEAYLGALMGLAGYYIAPTAYANIRMVTVDTHMGSDQRYMLWNPDELDGFRNGLDAAYTAVGEIPVLDIPVLIVTYALWIPALLVVVCLIARLRAAPLFVPWLVLLAFCIIAPVYDARYAVPIFDIMPLMVCAVAALLKRRSIARHLSGFGRRAM